MPSEATRALERVLPPLVHRLNNSLAAIQGVLELGNRAGERERDVARAELELLRLALTRLGALTRKPSAAAQSIELGALASALELLVRPLAESAGVRLELRLPALPLVARADGRLEAFLLALISELLEGARGSAGVRRLRLSVHAARGRAFLTVAVNAPVQSSMGVARAENGTADDTRLRRRCSAQRSGHRLSLPAQHGTESVPAAPPRKGARVLLLQHACEERHLMAEVLRQHDHRVVESSAFPAQGEFDFVLADHGLSERDPTLLERLRVDARLARARLLCLGTWTRGAHGLAVLEKPVMPRQLLAALHVRA